MAKSTSVCSAEFQKWENNLIARTHIENEHKRKEMYIKQIAFKSHSYTWKANERDVALMSCGRVGAAWETWIKHTVGSHTNLKNSQSIGVPQSLCRWDVCPAMSSVQIHAGYEVQLGIHPVQTPIGHIWHTHTHINRIFPSWAEIDCLGSKYTCTLTNTSL